MPPCLCTCGCGCKLTVPPGGASCLQCMEDTHMPSMSGVEFVSANKKPAHQKDRVSRLLLRMPIVIVALIIQLADSWRFILNSIPIVEAIMANRMFMSTAMNTRATIVMRCILSCRHHLLKSTGTCEHKVLCPGDAALEPIRGLRHVSRHLEAIQR
jgi:hypothetical protein